MLTLHPRKLPGWLLAALLIVGTAAAGSLPWLAGSARQAQAAAPAPFPAELQPYAPAWLAEFFPGDPARLAERLTDPATRHLVHGRSVYARYCLGCHGERGDGDGPAARMLVPRPRNFLYSLTPDDRPIFKFRSTASGQPPLRGDLEISIRNGLPGSAMPNHQLLDPKDVAAVTDYVLWLAQSSEFAQALRLAYADQEPDLGDERQRQGFYQDSVVEEARAIHERYQRPRILAVGAENERDAAGVARGREIYFKQGCQECHGAAGRGDGSSAPSLKDDWGFPVDPRDFSTGKFRAGSSGRDVYLRILGGVAGTPMPAFDSLSNEELWDLVHFIQSLKSAAGA